ncbi:unnamed protein product [Discosporangium mesarthrocarpum]
MDGLVAPAMNVRIATPEGYHPDPSVMELTLDLAQGSGSSLLVTGNPVEAVAGADIVVTDTWVSMGQEEEAAQRIKDYEGYQVTEELMRNAANNAIFLHCLPRHKEEVDDQVFYSERSLVFPEAENRMWTVMAVMQSMLGK